MTLYTGLDLLDGDGVKPDRTLEIINGRIAALRPRTADDQGTDLSDHGGRALICPAFVDLQVNGGAGKMLAQCASVSDLAALAEAHCAGGTVGVLPTLISDTPQTTARIIELVAAACAHVPALRGLHLEGPHLAVAGAHDPAHLRPMTDADLALYCDAAARVPHLMITLAPEQATHGQIATLADAGVRVSLGHTNCDYDSACAAFDAGAQSVTHLFNAMSGLHHRAPGLVGAALDRAAFIGLIADGVHVHPAALRLAMRARPEAMYLVSDAMAVAGTAARGFDLDGRQITRANGRLTLSDGTLAGADLTQARAVRCLLAAKACDLHTALKAGFDTPHRLVTGEANRLAEGQKADLLLVREDGPVAFYGPTGWSPLAPDPA